MRALATAGSLVVLAAALSSSAASPPSGSLQPSATSSPSTHATATGRLVAYEVQSRVLELQNALGRTAYHVAEDARAWLGTRRLPLEQLVRHLGAQATLAYQEVDDQRVTHTVRLRERAAGEP